jgi:hypothetical protein
MSDLPSSDSNPVKSTAQHAAQESGWAKPVDRLKSPGVPSGAVNLNVEGRQLSGLARGFGQMWQKTYKVRLSGTSIAPQEVITTWRENFPSFWPKGNNLYVPLRGIQPGEVGVINLAAPGGMKLSTGILVIYADETSFSFMTPEGHMFAGMITFSAYEEDGATVAQVQVLIRASDPIYEASFRLGFGQRVEDAFWQGTLTNLADRFGVKGQVVQQNVLVDPRVQWKEARNIWHNAGIRSALYMPVALVRRLLGK